MKKSKNRITLYNIASTVILQGLTFLSGPIFSAALGTNNYGIASVYLTWVHLASTVFSLQAAGTIAQAKIQFSDEEQLSYQSSVLSLSSLAYAGFSVITVIFAISGLIKAQIAMLCLGLFHGWGLYCVTAMNLKFTYEFDAKKNFYLSVFLSVSTILVSIFLINQFPREINFWGRIIAQSGIYTLTGVVLFVYLMRKGNTLYKKEYWLFSLPIAIPTIFHLLAHIVLGQSDKIMLQKMVGNSAAGIYALSCTFGAVVQTLYNAFNNSWVPFYYDYTKHDQLIEIKKHARNYMELFTILTAGFILLSKEVFHIYADKSFWSGTNLIPIFALGYFFVFLYSFPVNYEFYHKQTKTIAIGTSGAAVCNIVLNYLLIKRIGVQGAVIATAISHGLQFLFHFLYARTINLGTFPFRMMDFMPWIVYVICICIFYYHNQENWIARWGLGVALGCFLLYRVVKRREIF